MPSFLIYSFSFYQICFFLFLFRIFSPLPFYLSSMREEIVPFCKYVFGRTHINVLTYVMVGSVLTRRPISNMWQLT
jgi:hypothetical protein